MSITVRISYGMTGGAPPHRQFHGSEIVLSVPESMTVEQYLNLVRSKTRASVNLVDLRRGSFNPGPDDMQKTVKDAGLQDSAFQLWNGAMD